MIRLSPFFFIYFLAVAMVLGAVIASFVCCAASRYAAGQPPFGGRSHCTACGHTLGVLDLIPVVGYVTLRGKCRYCGANIPADSVICEVLLAVVFGLCTIKFDITPQLAKAMLLCAVLLAISLIDLATFIIPDGLLVLLIGIWLCCLPFGAPGAWLQGLIGGFGIAVPLLLIVLLMERILKKEAMGGGDIKLLFVTGLYLGLAANFLNLMVSCVLGVVFAACTKSRPDGVIPFGPAIAVGTVCTMLVGDPILAWYFRLF